MDSKDNINFGDTKEKSFAQYLQTVNDNAKLMTKNKIAWAKLAVEVQEFLGWPSVDEYIEIVRGNKIWNFNITIDDIKRSVDLYGVPTPYLHGYMTRRCPLKHDPLDHLQEPLPIELHDKRIELYMDLFKFLGVYFMLMESARIKYVQIDDIQRQTMKIFSYI